MVVDPAAGTGVEPRQLLALPQAAHRDAHHKTPLAQFRFEKLSIPLARKKDDRINAVEARRERGKHAVGPSAPCLDAHRVQGLFVGPDFFFRMNQAVLRRQDAPRAARRFHTGPRLSEPVGGVEVHRRRGHRPFGFHAGDQKQPAAVTVFQQNSSLLGRGSTPPRLAGRGWGLPRSQRALWALGVAAAKLDGPGRPRRQPLQLGESEHDAARRPGRIVGRGRGRTPGLPPAGAAPRDFHPPTARGGLAPAPPESSGSYRAAGGGSRAASRRASRPEALAVRLSCSNGAADRGPGVRFGTARSPD